MDAKRFDTIARWWLGAATRRRVLGGVGLVTVLSLRGRPGEAAPSPVAQCMKDCNADAKRARNLCGGHPKTSCLKQVKADRAACHQDCHTAAGQPTPPAS